MGIVSIAIQDPGQALDWEGRSGHLLTFGFGGTGVNHVARKALKALNLFDAKRLMLWRESEDRSLQLAEFNWEGRSHP